MSKTNKIYKIFMTTMIVAIAGMLLAMGIIAAQKTMKLGVQFSSNPNYKLAIAINTAENVIFQNFDNVIMDNGISSLNGNVLVADDEVFKDYGNDFTIIIKNYTESTGIEVSMTSTAKIDGGADGIPAQIETEDNTASKYSSGDPDSVSFRVYVNSVFPQTTTLKMTISELSGYTVTFDANDGSFSSGLDTATFEGQTSLPTTNIPIPTRDGYTFAGYYNTGNKFEATTIPSADLRYYSNDYLGNTGIAPENKELTEDTTLHARWLPFTVGSYVDATNGTLGNLVEGTTNVHYPAFAGYKYIQFKDAAAYNGYPLRWMIIGAGENKNSALAGADISQITSYAFDGNVNGKEGNNKELGAGQVLVLSEQVLRQNSFHSSSGVWEVSIVRDVLNGDFITDTNSNLNDYIGTYIVQPNKKLNTAYTSGSAVVNSIDTTATNGGSSYIFLLGSRFGGLVGDGNTASINAEIGKESSVAAATKEMYYVQNFVVEDYLGTQDVAAENVTEVTKTIDGVEYIYSGGGDYIRGTGTAPKLASFTGVIPSYWWLRSGYCYDREGEYVVNHGGFVEYKYADKILGVRPSFVLNLA